MPSLKGGLKTALLGAMLPWLRGSSHDVDAFLGRAVGVYDGSLTQEQLLGLLDDFYASHDVAYFQSVFGYTGQRSRILDSGYKLDILSCAGQGPRVLEMTGLWRRRMHLLRHLGIRMDWLLLRRGQTIPPHAHKGVLSGFMLIEGQVAIRHFHVLGYTPSTATVQATVDCDLEPGGFTVNAEHKDNIHWLQGLADTSILFRFNALRLPTAVPDLNHSAGRMYVDVSAVAASGTATEVPFVGAERVASLRIR